MINSTFGRNMDKDFLSLFSFDITPYTKEVEYKRGETILSSGGDGGNLIYIREGGSRCSYIYPDGVLTALDYAPSPAIYGELELLGVQKYTALVEAVTDAAAYSVNTLLIKEKLLSDAVFLRKLVEYTARKLFRVNMQMASSLSFPLRKRLAGYILDHERDGIYTMSHGEASAYLCVSYRHLLHVFSTFESEGLIERKSRGLYIVRNRRALERERIEC